MPPFANDDLAAVLSLPGFLEITPPARLRHKLSVRLLQPAPVNLHQPPACPKQSHLYRIHIQAQYVTNLLNSKSCYLFHNQHRQVFLVQFDEQSIEQVSLLCSLRSIPGMAEYAVAILRQPLHLPDLLFAQIRLINQRPDLLLSKIVPAFIHRDFV